MAEEINNSRKFREKKYFIT